MEVEVNSPSVCYDTTQYNPLDAVVTYVACEMSGNLLFPHPFLPWKQSWAKMRYFCDSHFELLLSKAYLHQRCGKTILKCYKMFWDSIIFIEEWYLIKIKHLDFNNISLKNAEIISGSQNVLADLPWENIVTSHFRIFIHFKIFAMTFYVIQLQDKLSKSNFYLSVHQAKRF